MDAYKNVEIKGNKLTISREDLALLLDTAIDVQLNCKTLNDITQWLIAAGYIEAIKDLLACFEDNA